MGNRNSQTEAVCEYHLGLFSNALTDLAHKYPEMRRSFVFDLRTIEDRVRTEGVSFLTKTLPKLGKAVLKGIENGALIRPREFKPYGRKAIPAFMHGMLLRMFDDDGTLSTEFHSEVFADFQKFIFLGYKSELPYNKEQEQSVIDSFVSNEQLLDELRLDALDPLLVKAREIVHCIFESFDPKDISPRHGPGAVATGEWGTKKWTFKRLFSKLNSYYPFWEYFSVGGDQCMDDMDGQYYAMERCTTGTAKVVLVPKDSRGPRLISCEPLEYQFIQQGLGRAFMRHIEAHWLTKGYVNFKKQSINREQALLSSFSGRMATLDMKDASDLVSTALVKALFPDKIWEALDSCRSSATRLPDGRVIEMKKFAPMGSALCFPVEAVCFFALCKAWLTLSGKRYSRADVYVYGDDIIVPSGAAYQLMDALERFGLRVNRDKCFVRGKFRESCGMDAYNGRPVIPIRNRVPYIGKSLDAKTAASAVSLANSFHRSGWTNTSSFLFKRVESVIGSLPYGTANASYLCREVPSSFMALVQNLERGLKVRWDPDCQRVMIRARFLKARPETEPFDGWERLLCNLLVPQESEPSQVVRPRSTQISTGWRYVG